MANFVNTSLDIIRRHRQPRRPRLHARWGDVAITAPIDGAWSQFDNPHLKGKKLYGPGFVPGFSSSTGNNNNNNKEVLLLDSDEWTSDEEEEKQKEKEKGKNASTSKARRLTRILLPSSVNTPTNKKTDEKDKEKEKSAVEFEYKPVRADYAQEIAEQLDQAAKPHFRYVPASERYFKELKNDILRVEERAGEETDNEKEVQGKSNINNANTVSRRKPTTQQRSQSCDPCVGTNTVLVTGRRKPRSQAAEEQGVNGNTSSILPRTLPSSTMPRKSTSSRNNNKTSKGEKEQHSSSNTTTHARDQNRDRVKQAPAWPQKISVQRLQSAVNKPRRRTMTLDMVGDQDDLW